MRSFCHKIPWSPEWSELRPGAIRELTAVPQNLLSLLRYMPPFSALLAPGFDPSGLRCFARDDLPYNLSEIEMTLLPCRPRDATGGSGYILL